MAAITLAASAAFALDAVAEDHRRDAGLASHLGGGLEGHLRGGDEVGLIDPGEARVIRLHRLALAGLEQPAGALGRAAMA